MSIAIVAREHEEEAEGFFAQTNIKVGGGDALNYDSSLRVRVVRDYEYTGEGKARQMVGERHTLEIRKTKLGTKGAAIPRGYFYTSNGLLSPVGFDTARDLFEMGRERGAITTRGSHYYYQATPLGMGQTEALNRIRTTPELMERLDVAMRDKRTEEHVDPETGEVT
jgi:hypothetical protein